MFKGKNQDQATNSLITVKGTEVTPKRAVKYLGVHLDHMLTLVQHVKTRISATQAMMGLMRRLGGTTKGLPVHQATKIIKTIVIPQLLYGSQMWWRGTGKKRARYEEYCLDIINRTLKAAIRAALPVYKTTPIGVLHPESRIPDARTPPDEARDRDCLRMGKLPKEHPVAEAIGRKAHKKSQIEST